VPPPLADGVTFYFQHNSNYPLIIQQGPIEWRRLEPSDRYGRSGVGRDEGRGAARAGGTGSLASLGTYKTTDELCCMANLRLPGQYRLALIADPEDRCPSTTRTTTSAPRRS
jgi:hypothetical protein